MLAISTASIDSESQFSLSKIEFCTWNDVTCTLLAIYGMMLTIKIHQELLFLPALYLDDLYANWSLAVCFTVLHIARHFSSCFTISGRTNHPNKTGLLTTTITAPLLHLRCPSICILCVKLFACLWVSWNALQMWFHMQKRSLLGWPLLSSWCLSHPYKRICGGWKELNTPLVLQLAHRLWSLRSVH